MYLAFFTLFLLCVVSFADVAVFKSNYEDSRRHYLRSVAQVETSKIKSIYQLQFPDPSDPSLVTDVTWLQNTNKADGLIVIISGLHGIEGLTGSAVQSYLLQNIKLNTPSDYLFIHALNPFGFKNFRRADRDNIDLNRNFALNARDYLAENPEYSRINKFLNPVATPELHFLSRSIFVFSALKLIFENSIETLRRSILVGQYQHPKGLYYGGAKAAYQKTIIDQLHGEILNKYRKVFVVDIHTGYGARNKLHILVNSKNQPTAPLLAEIFSSVRIDFGDQKNFYKVTGDLLSYLESKSEPGNLIFGAAFEFGTLDSQKTMGSIESLRRMILENQKHHFPASENTTQKIDLLFSDLFYPEDTHWRTEVLKNARSELLKIENFLAKSPQ